MSKQTFSQALDTLKRGMGIFAPTRSCIDLSLGGSNQGEVKNCLTVVEDSARASGLQPEHILSLSEFIASRSTSQ